MSEPAPRSVIADAIEGCTTIPNLSRVTSSALAQEILDGLNAASFVVVPILSANQCGTCQHYSWEHIGPVHPCGLCDCERYKPADPDRQDDDLPEPD